MARGDTKISVNYIRKCQAGDYSPARSYKYLLTSATFSSINANSVTGISGLTGVLASAGAYENGGNVAAPTLTASTNTITFDTHDVEIPADPANPSTARTLIIYADSPVNGSQVASTDVVAIVDLTTDGSTAINLTNGVNALSTSGIYTVVVNA